MHAPDRVKGCTRVEQHLPPLQQASVRMSGGTLHAALTLVRSTLPVHQCGPRACVHCHTERFCEYRSSL